MVQGRLAEKKCAFLAPPSPLNKHQSILILPPKDTTPHWCTSGSLGNIRQTIKNLDYSSEALLVLLSHLSRVRLCATP